MSPIKNKRNFVRRYRAGEFGNASPTWDTVREFIDHFGSEWPPDDQLFHLRNREPGGITYYNLPYLAPTIHQYVDKSGWYVSSMAPTKKTVLQGEVRRSCNGLELRYTQVRKPMRDALATEQRTVYGLQAVGLLQYHMDDNSYGWLTELLDNYDNHIVEFSTYSVCWGTIPGFNSVFWEIRPDRGFGSNHSSFTEVY